MNIEVIVVGDEVLRGEVDENNARFISRSLSRIGAMVDRVVIVGDERNRLVTEIEQAVRRNELVIITGGLGPTGDDLTKDALIEALNLKTEWRYEILEGMRKRLEAFGRSLPDSYKDQARVPIGSKVLENSVGLAVGLELTYEGCEVFLLPGVPSEMKTMFERYVIPFVKTTNLADGADEWRRIRFFGLTETELEERLMQSGLHDTGQRISIISSPSSIDLYLPARTLNSDFELKLKKHLGSFIFSLGDEGLHEVVVRKLLSQRKTLSVAESITGGLISSLIVSVPGASASFISGIVAYSNKTKIEVLKVKESSIERFGAVSKEVCVEMVEGLRHISGTDFTLATTGIAGPTGGSPEKPVGLCYIGLATPEGVFVRKHLFPGDRDMVRTLAANSAFDLLRLFLFEYFDRLNPYKV